MHKKDISVPSLGGYKRLHISVALTLIGKKKILKKKKNLPAGTYPQKVVEDNQTIIFLGGGARSSINTISAANFTFSLGTIFRLTNIISITKIYQNFSDVSCRLAFLVLYYKIYWYI